MIMPCTAWYQHLDLGTFQLILHAHDTGRTSLRVYMYGHRAVLTLQLAIEHHSIVVPLLPAVLHGTTCFTSFWVTACDYPTG